MKLTKSLVLWTVYSFLLKGVEILAKCFARQYDAVPIFETIGRSGNLSTLSDSGSLW